jgi:hypothetical protein
VASNATCWSLTAARRTLAKEGHAAGKLLNNIVGEALSKARSMINALLKKAPR